MPSESENLQTALDNVIEKIVEVTANPKPTYSVDGQSVSWGDYYRMLMDMRKQLREALVETQDPFEYYVIGDN